MDIATPGSSSRSTTSGTSTGSGDGGPVAQPPGDHRRAVAWRPGFATATLGRRVQYSWRVPVALRRRGTVAAALRRHVAEPADTAFAPQGGAPRHAKADPETAQTTRHTAGGCCRGPGRTLPGDAGSTPIPTNPTTARALPGAYHDLRARETRPVTWVPARPRGVLPPGPARPWAMAWRAAARHAISRRCARPTPASHAPHGRRFRWPRGWAARPPDPAWKRLRDTDAAGPLPGDVTGAQGSLAPAVPGSARSPRLAMKHVGWHEDAGRFSSSARQSGCGLGWTSPSTPPIIGARRAAVPAGDPRC